MGALEWVTMTNLISVAGKDWNTGREYVVTASDSQTTYSDNTIARERFRKVLFHGSGFVAVAGNTELMNCIFSEFRRLQNDTGDLGPPNHIGELARDYVTEKYSNAG